VRDCILSRSSAPPRGARLWAPFRVRPAGFYFAPLLLGRRKRRSSKGLERSIAGFASHRWAGWLVRRSWDSDPSSTPPRKRRQRYAHNAVAAQVPFSDGRAGAATTPSATTSTITTTRNAATQWQRT